MCARACVALMRLTNWNPTESSNDKGGTHTHTRSHNITYKFLQRDVLTAPIITMKLMRERNLWGQEKGTVSDNIYLCIWCLLSVNYFFSLFFSIAKEILVMSHWKNLCAPQNFQRSSSILV